MHADPGQAERQATAMGPAVRCQGQAPQRGQRPGLTPSTKEGERMVRRRGEPARRRGSAAGETKNRPRTI